MQKKLPELSKKSSLSLTVDSSAESFKQLYIKLVAMKNEGFMKAFKESKRNGP